MNNGAEILTTTGADSTGDAGTIDITTSLVSVNNQAKILANTFGSGKGGDIRIEATDIQLDNQAILNTSTSAQGDAGDILIKDANQVLVDNNSQLTAETSGSGKPGNIDITSQIITVGKNARLSATATETASNLEGGANINLKTPNLNIAGELGIFAETQGQSPAGNLNINSGNNPDLKVNFTENGFISARTQQSGEGGDIAIAAPNSINIQGQGQVTVATSGSGNAGTIEISSDQLTLANGVSVIASTESSGDAGDILLNAKEITLDQAEIIANTSGAGKAGAIAVNTEQLILENGSTIQTNTDSLGNAGDIDLRVREQFLLTDSIIEASTSTSSSGDGGSIFVETDDRPIILNDRAQINLNSQGSGNAGNLFLTADSLLLNNVSQISATTTSGQGGNINLVLTGPQTLRLANNSRISATAGGEGDGGNVNIFTNFLIATENSDITTNAFEGRGGNINIFAQGIFLCPTCDISASSQLGVDGVVQTNTPPNDPSRSLADLPETVIDPNSLIQQNVCRQSGDSEFTITGRGGLPTSPDQTQTVTEVEVNLIEPTDHTSSSPPDQVSPDSTTKSQPETFLPVKGWKYNDKGELILLSYDPTQQNPPRQNHQTYDCP